MSKEPTYVWLIGFELRSGEGYESRAIVGTKDEAIALLEKQRRIYLEWGHDPRGIFIGDNGEGRLAIYGGEGTVHTSEGGLYVAERIKVGDLGKIRKERNEIPHDPPAGIFKEGWLVRPVFGGPAMTISKVYWGSEPYGSPIGWKYECQWFLGDVLAEACYQEEMLELVK